MLRVQIKSDASLNPGHFNWERTKHSETDRTYLNARVNNGQSISEVRVASAVNDCQVSQPGRRDEEAREVYQDPGLGIG